MFYSFEHSSVAPQLERTTNVHPLFLDGQCLFLRRNVGLLLRPVELTHQFNVFSFSFYYFFVFLETLSNYRNHIQLTRFFLRTTLLSVDVSFAIDQMIFL